MMNRIAEIKITIDELPEGGYLAEVEEVDGPDLITGPDIYGNTLPQIVQRIRLRLDKLIVGVK